MNPILQNIKHPRELRVNEHTVAICLEFHHHFIQQQELPRDFQQLPALNLPTPHLSKFYLFLKPIFVALHFWTTCLVANEETNSAAEPGEDKR